MPKPSKPHRTPAQARAIERWREAVRENHQREAESREAEKRARAAFLHAMDALYGVHLGTVVMAILRCNEKPVIARISHIEVDAWNDPDLHYRKPSISVNLRRADGSWSKQGRWCYDYTVVQSKYLPKDLRPAAPASEA